MREGKSRLCSSSARSRSPLGLVSSVSLVEAELGERWGSARCSREPFKAASPKRAGALARGQSVCLVLSLVCGRSFSCTQAHSSSEPFSLLVLPDPLPRAHPRRCLLTKLLCTVYWNGETGVLGYLRGWATAWEQRCADVCRLRCSEPAAESSVPSRVGRKGRSSRPPSGTALFSPYLGTKLAQSHASIRCRYRQTLTGEIPLPCSRDDSRDVTFSNS